MLKPNPIVSSGGNIPRRRFKNTINSKNNSNIFVHKFIKTVYISLQQRGLFPGFLKSPASTGNFGLPDFLVTSRYTEKISHNPEDCYA
jgi:hypothetical protein